MGRSSRNSEEKVSFFAFQDIITAVIGISGSYCLDSCFASEPEEREGRENPETIRLQVELIEGQNDGGGNATIVVASEFNASEVIEEIAQLHQEISDEKREFLVKGARKRTARSSNCSRS